MCYNSLMVQLFRYRAIDDREPFTEWLKSLRSRQAKARILVRLERLATGNFGDCKPCREGVKELRINYGQGYRIYFAQIGQSAILLLAGGDKRTQDADIAEAVSYLRDFKGRRT